MFRKITQCTLSEKFLLATLLILIGLFSFSIFKNIQYPLLWSDEADTAMFAQRILQYGYPKVHDGKNVLNQNPNKLLAVDDKTDAYIESDWSQFYFTAIFLPLVNHVNDLYLKTAMLRIPFGILGIAGVGILSISVIRIFETRKQKLLFLLLFVFLELLSIPLVLHLREVRYYSLIFFLTGCLLYVYLHYHIYKEINYWTYSILLIFLLILILFTYHPAFFIFILVFSLHSCIQLVHINYIPIIKIKSHTQSSIKLTFERKDFRRVVSLLFPLTVSIILSVPYIIFFKTFYFASEMSKFFHFNSDLYIKHLIHILDFFGKFELLPITIILIGIIGTFWFHQSRKFINSSLKKQTQVLFLLILFFLIYISIIARNPYYPFTRYYIILQPILTVIFLLALFIVSKLILSLHNTIKKIYLIIFFIIISLGIFTQEFRNRNYLSGHLYELFHQYEGPLDYVIPYIQNHFRNSTSLIIATNFEELSYMFYLNSKVIIGYGMNNLQEDIKETPDIVIYRRGWGHDPDIFNFLLRKSNYSKVNFPIADYPLNNIPEFDFYFNHLFKTRIASSDNDRLTIFVRK